MKVWNLSVKKGADGSKHLDVQVHGVIDGDWLGMGDGVSTKDAIAELNQHRDAKTIGVRINSVGGSAFGGVALYNALQSHPGEVTCYVEGLAASAASLIAMAGKCVMGVGSMLMIHSPLSILMGNAEQFRTEADRLDKVQNALAGIYTAKTGKGLDEVNELLDEETWMSAEEAVAAGFADAIGEDDEEESESDPDDPEEDDDEEEDAAPAAPQMIAGDMISWRGAAFPVARVPQQIVAMASPAPTPTTIPLVEVVDPPAPPPVIASVPAPEEVTVAVTTKGKRRRLAQARTAATPPVLSVVPPPASITRAEIELRAPDVLAAYKAEGRAAGIAEERARLQAIDELAITGCTELVTAAKYGDAPTDANALAVAVVKAGKHAGAELLRQRRVESRVLANVVMDAPDQNGSTEEARLIQAMVDGGNSRRGGAAR